MWTSNSNSFILRLRSSKFIKDSFWSLFGNGLGSFILLVSGVIIARFLGKDLYGEYGVVKTNMFYMAGFSTFGMVYSSTRCIAYQLSKDKTRVVGIIRNSLKITSTFSAILAIVLTLFAGKLAEFLQEPDLTLVFRFLSVIIILKALASTGNGILAGLGKFATLAKGNVLSGGTMFLMCIPLTYFCGLYGALFSLAFSQLFNAAFNFWYIHKETSKLPIYYKSEDDVSSLIKFSFPIALQEISYAVCNWGGIVLLTKLSTMGEVGLYSASAQWNAVITAIPALLSNVVLSYLSGSEGEQQKRLLYRMLLIYFSCTLVPFICVYLFSDIIVSFYGSDFSSMKSVLLISIFATIPLCCSDVFKAELIALGKTWWLFSLRMVRDLICVCAAGFFLFKNGGANGAYYYAMSSLIGAIAFFFGAYMIYLYFLKTNRI